VTESDLAALALKKLGVIGAQEEPSADDAAEAVASYERYFAELDERALATWSVETPPSWAGEGLANVLAARLRPMFTPDKYDEREEDAAERGLLRTIMRGKTNVVTEGEYF
jgi:hypothetical protein